MIAMNSNIFLVLMEKEINVDQIIFKLLDNPATPQSALIIIFKTFSINFNLKDDSGKNVFKYFLDRNLPLSLIKENDKIDYNELIKDLIF